MLNPKARITIGMDRTTAVGLIGRLSGKEFTPKVEFANTEAGNMTTRLFYQFVNYDAVLVLDCKDGKVFQMIYWTKNNFGGDKQQQNKTARKVAALKFDSVMYQVTFELF